MSVSEGAAIANEEGRGDVGGAGRLTELNVLLRAMTDG